MNMPFRSAWPVIALLGATAIAPSVASAQPAPPLTQVSVYAVASSGIRTGSIRPSEPSPPRIAILVRFSRWPSLRSATRRGDRLSSTATQ